MAKKSKAIRRPDKKPKKLESQEICSLIERVAGLSVSQPVGATVTSIFFLRETFERELASLVREVSRAFKQKELAYIEIFSSNHLCIMVGMVHHHSADANILSRRSSQLFKTEFGASLYSKTLKGIFHVFPDIQRLTKVKELFAY